MLISRFFKLSSLFIAIFLHSETIYSFEYLQHLANQVMISRALYVAADLELAECLQVPQSLRDLAQKTNVDFQALKRLMRCLIEYGVFTYTENGLISNNDASVFLQKSHPQTIRPFILHDDPTRWNALGNLWFSIKTGTPSFNELYQADYFNYLKSNSQLSKRFDEAMTIISQQEDHDIAEKINFYGTVADIGGGKGQLLESIYKKHSAVNQLILFDLEQVQHNITKNQWMTCVAGSFFDPLAIRADIFILKRILHDWSDEKALQILRNVADAMDINSTLLIVDAVIDQCRDKKLILDIDLRLLSIFGGQERTLVEWQLLCAAVGLEIVAVQELSSISHVITCKRKET